MKFGAVHPFDLVIVCGWHGYRKQSVAKVTATQVTLQDGWRFMRSTGKRVGESHNREPHYIEPFDEDKFRQHINDLEERHKRKLLVNHIRATRVHELTTSQMQRIVAIIAEPEQDT